ncbi:hypothetical protein SCLCIDRAFT_856449 [Scleroderma citrinum Foug A]|uniref:Uncharacterized protein n=1 Tax=Scleroderma citrinum Foug A TaxID=1036808 RepID=A0A0C3E146_9AGAM|nr:hypothetical protein SCLCIDRAFT_856449 [Scleroderma citrinum Foug A]
MECTTSETQSVDQWLVADCHHHHHLSQSRRLPPPFPRLSTPRLVQRRTRDLRCPVLRWRAPAVGIRWRL